MPKEKLQKNSLNRRPSSVKLLVILQSVVAAFFVGGGSFILAAEGVSIMTMLLGGIHVILGLS